MGKVRAFVSASNPDFLDRVARAVARRGSLQRLDAVGRFATHFSPQLRDYRLARALAVTGNLAGREHLAYTAARGKATYADITRALDDYRGNDQWAQATAVLRHLNPRKAQLLAWVMFNQNSQPHDAERALALLEWVRERSGTGALSGIGRQAYIELLVATGQYSRARAELPPLESASATEQRWWLDAINPYLDGNDDQPLEAWLSLLAKPYEHAGLLPPVVPPSADSKPFQHLHTAAVTPVDGPERVTVVMSSHRPDQAMLDALRSVTLSSWRNLEILLFDDASGDAYQSWYDRAKELDPRIVVHKMPYNIGTYRIRNRALDVATGDVITFHDSDDWMHPQRLERQVLHLRTRPHLAANISTSVRVTPDLAFVNRRSLGPKICEPSIMVRRTEATAKVGYFDPIRKAADAEYRHRLEAGFGEKVPIATTVPLTYQLTASESLSDADIRRYWTHLERRIHRSAYEQWHRTSLSSGTTPFVDDSEDGEQRQYYAPPLLKEHGGGTVDVVLASNWLDASRWGKSERAKVKAVRAWSQAGLRVAITHVDELWSGPSMRLSLGPAVVTLLNEGVARYVSPGHEMEAAVLALTPDARKAHDERGVLGAIAAHHVVTVPLDSGNAGARDEAIASVLSALGRDAGDSA